MININKYLPNNLIIESSGSHLYRTGLSLFPFGNKPRFRFCNPVFIWIITFIQLCKSFASLLINQSNDKIYIFIGDIFYFFGLKSHGNILYIFAIFLILSSLLSHYLKYKKGIKPIYLKPFEMMCGLVSPLSIGLYDYNDILKLLKKTKFLFDIYKKISYCSIPAWFSVGFIALGINSTSLQLFIYSLAWSLFNCLLSQFWVNISFYEMIYFRIISYYLKLKLTNINKMLKQSRNSKIILSNNYFNSIMIELNSIYSEIYNYNKTYWSQYLMKYIIILIIIICFTLFMIIHNILNLLFKIIFIYVNIVVLCLLFSYLNTSSSLYYEANKSYKYFNSLITLNNALNINYEIRLKVLK
jgi:hypothetical protein